MIFKGCHIGVAGGCDSSSTTLSRASVVLCWTTGCSPSTWFTSWVVPAWWFTLGPHQHVPVGNGSATSAWQAELLAHPLAGQPPDNMEGWVKDLAGWLERDRLPNPQVIGAHGSPARKQGCKLSVTPAFVASRG
eukprot:3130404-Prorocentrum_lima.AAC.1